MIEQSIAVRGPKLYNSLPRDLQVIELTVEAFKQKLDIFLQKIEDKPYMTGYNVRVAGNSILHHQAQMRADGVFI